MGDLSHAARARDSLRSLHCLRDPLLDGQFWGETLVVSRDDLQLMSESSIDNCGRVCLLMGRGV